MTLLLASHDEAIKSLFNPNPNPKPNPHPNPSPHPHPNPNPSPNQAIKSLFHEPTDGEDPIGFDSRVLTFVVFTLFSFGCGLLTYGCAVPSGLFVPAIMSGAAMGRYPNPNPTLTLNPKP